MATPSPSGDIFISLAPHADANAFAVMMADLVRQNLDEKPQKRKYFHRLARGKGVRIALVADDAGVALTLAFCDGGLVVHDGILGVPDVAVRASSDILMAMSNIPLTRLLALPIPTDRAALDVLRSMVAATRTRELQTFGMIGNLGVLSRLTRVMSVNG